MRMHFLVLVFFYGEGREKARLTFAHPFHNFLVPNGLARTMEREIIYSNLRKIEIFGQNILKQSSTFFIQHNNIGIANASCPILKALYRHISDGFLTVPKSS